MKYTPRIILLIIIAALSFSGCQDRPTEGPTLDVMSFNIRFGTAKDGDNHWEKRRDLVFGVLRDHQPQVVGLQEALDFQIDEIQAAFPEYGRLGIGRDGANSGEYSAVLYLKDNYEVLDANTFWLSDTPDVRSTSWGNNLNRICTWARLRDKQTNRSFYVFNTHFDHKSEPSRVQSALLVDLRIASRSEPNDPFVLTGDFNASEDSEAIRSLKKAGMIDTFRAQHPDAESVGTFNSWRGASDGRKIDYVFVGPSTEVLEAEILRDNTDGRYPSDHYPVKARLQFAD